MNISNIEAVVRQLAELTDSNEHNEAAKVFIMATGNKEMLAIMKGLEAIVAELGYTPEIIYAARRKLLDTARSYGMHTNPAATARLWMAL